MAILLALLLVCAVLRKLRKRSVSEWRKAMQPTGCTLRLMLFALSMFPFLGES